MKKIITILTLVIMSNSYSQNNLPYKNPKLPVEKRVEDLLSRMSLEEKIDLLGGHRICNETEPTAWNTRIENVPWPLGVSVAKVIRICGWDWRCRIMGYFTC